VAPNDALDHHRKFPGESTSDLQDMMAGGEVGEGQRLGGRHATARMDHLFLEERHEPGRIG
jgi:hypothetical protein